MAYWIKYNETRESTYTEDGESIPYTLKRYQGPYRFLAEAEKDLIHQGEWEILEFDG